MALPMKKLEFAASAKRRLDLLECSYTEGMSEMAVADLLLSPGEGRQKVVHWLLSRYNSKLEAFLDPSYTSFGRRTESRIQRLLTAANAMCLCKYDDVDLIKGEGSLSKQINFIDTLLDLVCTRERNNAAEAHSQPSVRQCNSYMDSLSSQDEYLCLLDPTVDLLPRDIQAEVERVWTVEGWDRNTSPPVPKLEELAMQSENLAKELQKQNATLETLQQQVTVQGSSKTSELITMTHMLATVVRELRQLVDGFTHCYESNISQWCYKTPAKLSELGAVFKRVHVLMLKFVKLFDDINKIRQIQTKLVKHTKDVPDARQVLGQASRAASESFQRCLSVLEESLHRSDSNFTSKHSVILDV